MANSLYFNKVLADIIWHQSIISCVSTVSLVPMDQLPVCDGKRDGSLLCYFFELLRMFLQKEYTNTVLTNLTGTNSSNTALITSSVNLCLRFIEVWDVSSLHIGLGYHSDGYCFLYMWTCLHCENFRTFYNIPVLNIKPNQTIQKIYFKKLLLVVGIFHITLFLPKRIKFTKWMWIICFIKFQNVSG